MTSNISTDRISDKAFKLTLASLTLQNSVFTSSHSLAETYYSNLHLINGEFSNLNLWEWGIKPIESNVTITNCSFFNISSDWSTLAFMEIRKASTINIDKCNFRHISMPIFIGSVSKFNMRDTVFENMSIQYEKSFINFYNLASTIQNCSFTNLKTPGPILSFKGNTL